MKNKTLIVLVGILCAVVALFAVGKKIGWWGKPKHTKVSAVQVTPKTIVESVRANGKIFPVNEVKISPDVSGEIVELYVQEGDSVKAGQLLAILNADLYRSATDRANSAVNSAMSGLENVKAQIGQFQAQLDNAQANYNRQLSLYKDGIISKAELDASETQLKTAKSTLNAAKENINMSSYNIKSAQATAKEARDNMRRTMVYAPISGIVSLLNVKKGEKVVGNIQMAGTEMMRIANFSAMEAQVDVNENDVININVGDTSIIEVDAYANRTFKGVVTQIASSAKGLATLTSALGSASDQVTNFVIKIKLLPSDYADLQRKSRLPFRPGMSCSVDILTETHTNVLSVPAQCVTTRMPDEIKKYRTANIKTDSDEPIEVAYILKDNKVYAMPVKTGIQDDKNIEILEGLHQNDWVIDGPYNAISRILKDSMPVNKVRKEDLFEAKKEK